MTIEEMRQSMTKANVYSKADIDKICELEKQYREECQEMFYYHMKSHYSQTKMIKDYIKPSEEKAEEGSENKTATDSDSKEEEKTEEKPSEETAVLTYQGKNYTVNKAVFEKWLAENGTLTK